MKLWNWILKMFGGKKKYVMKVETSQPITEYLKDVKPVDEVTKDKITDERKKNFLKKKRTNDLSGLERPRTIANCKKMWRNWHTGREK